MIVNGKEIARVFPRRTKATPDDDRVVRCDCFEAIPEEGDSE